MIKVEKENVQYEGKGKELCVDVCILAYSLMRDGIPFSALIEAVANGKVLLDKEKKKGGETD